MSPLLRFLRKCTKVVPSDGSAIFLRENNLPDENSYVVDDGLNETSAELAAALTRCAADQLLTCPAPWTDAQRDGLRALLDGVPG
jgi:hypothetical protein